MEIKLDCIDSSDTQLLFGDIFLIKKNKCLADFSVSDYGLFYSLTIDEEDCFTSDSEDDDNGSDLEDFIVNDDVDDELSDGESSDELDDDLDDDLDDELSDDLNDDLSDDELEEDTSSY